MHGTSRQIVTDLVAQGLTNSSGSSGLQGLQNWLVPLLIAGVGIIVVWRSFIVYAKGEKKDTPEAQGKSQLDNILNASIAIALIAVGSVVIAWVASIIMDAVN